MCTAIPKSALEMLSKMIYVFFSGNCDEFLFVFFHLCHKLSTIICARYLCIAKHVYLFVVVDL